MGRTGLIPATFADQAIKFRIPYLMGGELNIIEDTTGNFFPEATFLHNRDKPFEIWSMRVRLTALDENLQVIANQPQELDKLVRLSVTDTTKNEKMTKTPTLVSLVRNSEQGSQGDWVWYVPYTFERSEGFQIQCDALPFTTNFPNISQIRVEIGFDGYLDVIQPASETR